MSYIKQKGKNFSFYDLKKDLELTDGQLDIIKLQLLELGFIKEIKHYEGENELNPLICRNCSESNSCTEKNGLSIKMYQLTQKAIDYMK